MKQKYLLFLLFFLPSFFISQNNKAVKFIDQLKTAGEDTNKLNILDNIIDQLEIIEDWKSYNITYGNLSQKLLNSPNAKIKDCAQRHYALFLNNCGSISLDKNDNETARKQITNSLQLLEKLNYIKGLASAYNNMGELLGAEGDDEKAMEYFTRSLELEKRTADKAGMGSTYNSMAL
ncbi:MAG: tetratricopeptide repeat protein, partial [Bacteroidia bacterium]